MILHCNISAISELGDFESFTKLVPHSKLSEWDRSNGPMNHSLTIVNINVNNFFSKTIVF